MYIEYIVIYLRNTIQEHRQMIILQSEPNSHKEVNPDIPPMWTIWNIKILSSTFQLYLCI